MSFRLRIIQIERCVGPGSCHNKWWKYFRRRLDLRMASKHGRCAIDCDCKWDWRIQWWRRSWQVFRRQWIPKRRGRSSKTGQILPRMSLTHKSSSKRRVNEDVTFHFTHLNIFSSIIGRIAIAEQSHYRGRVEALGYIELNSFIQLRHSSGKVRVRNPNSVKLVDAYVKTLYSQ